MHWPESVVMNESNRMLGIISINQLRRRYQDSSKLWYGRGYGLVAGMV